MVIEHRRRTERPAPQRLLKVLVARGVDRLPEHRSQRQRAGADNALRAVAAVAKSQFRQLFQGLRIATAAQNTGRLIKDEQRAGTVGHKLPRIFQRRLADGQQRGFATADRFKGQPLRLMRRLPGFTLHKFAAAMPRLADNG